MTLTLYLIFRALVALVAIAVAVALIRFLILANRRLGANESRVSSTGWYAFFQKDDSSTGRFVPLVCWSVEGDDFPKARGMVIWPSGEDKGGLAYCDQHPNFTGYYFKPKGKGS